MVSIPDGDWFCYDCVSKATGKCHCFVCGLTKAIRAPGTSESAIEPANRLVQCATCSRGAHMSCLRPPINRPPKRWNCMFCIANGASLSEKSVSPDTRGVSVKSLRNSQVAFLLISPSKRVSGCLFEAFVFIYRRTPLKLPAQSVPTSNRGPIEPLSAEVKSQGPRLPVSPEKLVDPREVLIRDLVKNGHRVVDLRDDETKMMRVTGIPITVMTTTTETIALMKVKAREVAVGAVKKNQMPWL